MALGLVPASIPTLKATRILVGCWCACYIRPHFRTDALRQCGGWDPYNVTEDADLGIRLARFGWRLDVISLPTFEEAPERIGIWFRQRTRWLKGWLQTVLVHSRNPVRTFRELGLRGTMMYHLAITAIVVSILSHPFFIAIAAVDLWRLAVGGTRDPLVLWVTGLVRFQSGRRLFDVDFLCQGDPGAPGRAGFLAAAAQRSGLLAADLRGRLAGAMETGRLAAPLGEDSPWAGKSPRLRQYCGRSVALTE